MLPNYFCCYDVFFERNHSNSIKYPDDEFNFARKLTLKIIIVKSTHQGLHLSWHVSRREVVWFPWDSSETSQRSGKVLPWHVTRNAIAVNLLILLMYTLFLSIIIPCITNAVRKPCMCWVLPTMRLWLRQSMQAAYKSERFSFCRKNGVTWNCLGRELGHTGNSSKKLIWNHSRQKVLVGLSF